MDSLVELELQEFSGRVMQLLYREREYESAAQLLSPGFVWIGARGGDESFSFAQLLNYWSVWRGDLPHCALLDEAYQIEELSPEAWLCAGGFRLEMAPEAYVYTHITLLIRRMEGTLRGVRLHSSGQSGAENLPALEDQRQAYDKLIQKNHQMQVVLKAVQGGLKISRDDSTYSYTYVSDELCALFGYTQEEFMQVTGGNAVGAVYEPDLPRVLRECEEAFRDGSLDYAIKYRVRCKDGSQKWIIDSGRKMKNDAGETLINSIYLDVTELEQANLQIAKQRELLGSIYNSIMCGILRYRTQGSAFEYLTMNSEAMRIMGYASQEECLTGGLDGFYARVHEEDRAVMRTRIAALQNNGERFSHEYRVIAPDGSITWVYGTAERLKDVDGTSVIQRAMIDITDRKKLELALVEERQRFRIALENTPAIIFEYDIRADSYSAFGTLEARQGKHNMERTISSFSNRLQHMVEEAYQQRFYALLRGEGGSEEQMRMALFLGSSEFVWARITVTVLRDREGTPIKTIGKVSNIQSEKEKEFALLEAKSRDGLTGLYNKDVGIRLIKQFMEQKSPSLVCGMMLLDMDDFERLNEEEGSVFADAVLQEVANVLRAETGRDDIQIRLGGDEFMLFVKGCNKARAALLGPRIAQLVSQLIMQGNEKARVSVSIGMCVTEVVDEYTGLYRCAESTLKYVKEHARGRAACYLDTSNELGTVLTQLYTEKHFINEISRPTDHREEDLAAFALELLGKSRNLDDAIFLLLARIGKTYHLDRVSILEIDRDYLSYRFSYQWAANPTDLQMGQAYYVSAEQFACTTGVYDTDGLFEGNIHADMYHFPSCLHAAILNQGAYAGSLSFEVGLAQYSWTPEQKKLIREMVRIISSFVMKARADALSQAKTDFLSRMSHEIRTPMNAISGMTSIAKAVIADRERTLDCLDKIESANSYLLSLINDVLDMSRIESGKVELFSETTDLARLLEDLVALLQPQAAAKDIHLTVENEIDENRLVMVDVLRLNQVLMNIVGNAIKFTPPSGRVTVRATPMQVDARGVSVQFLVEDTGIGIARETMGRIFNAFEQAGKETSARYGGTGLGLSISNRLVQMMGGSLEVQSEVGVGSSFYFTLPLPFGSEPPLPRIERTGTARLCDFTGRRLLLAEDNELNREIAQTILEMNGFQVVCASDGREALELYTAGESGAFDAVLMDIRMPVMDGLEATKRIRTSERPDARRIPIIAMTANAFDEDTKKSMESGMDGHLTKPIDIDTLLNMLEQCLDRH